MVCVPPSPVDELLMMGVNVTVYSGQLDLIVDTIGKSSRGLALFPDSHIPVFIACHSLCCKELRLVAMRVSENKTTASLVFRLPQCLSLAIQIYRNFVLQATNAADA